MHRVKYQNSPNFLVWKFCGNAVSAEFSDQCDKESLGHAISRKKFVHDTSTGPFQMSPSRI